MKILGNEDVALHVGFDLAYLSSQKSSDYINVQHAARPVRVLMNLVSAPTKAL